MSCLTETQPELVEAARVALESVESVGPELAREATFTFRNSEWWTKITIDPHANTIEKWDIFPAEQKWRRW